MLYAIKVPRRDGKPLGGTEFANMHAAYDALPDEIKTRLDGMTALHDFNKFWEMMRARPGSWRKPLTPEQRRRSRRCRTRSSSLTRSPAQGAVRNPGYAIRINELPESESDEMLEFLFDHQLQPRFRYCTTGPRATC